MTVEEVTNPEPVAVMTAAALPAIAALGVREVNVTGTGGAGGAPDPPPHADNANARIVNTR
jgi:hypothetical protein